ncbi:predicted protein [Histoplasma mississippiense (nom. inval.)]|uniref:predicted protein n=1 Tax=Ajellomyces capsulatus (strain NAm1 / WU24) TaxID=2059318 RepID=UPI000157C715|nr:predicted protein [Histoplasma mississippiense (nom. inval.)]EDN08148.1 predicted protein [Histoplasma mississippiense (nom. inval.)]
MAHEPCPSFTTSLPEDSSEGTYSEGPTPRGRWLNRDELERNSRQIQFDFTALCDRAIRVCPGATKVVGYEKREGGFNRVFIFAMDNGSCVVARLPTSIAGAPKLTTNSEVATMTYLKTKLSLPIPKILDWNDDQSNPIGAEYIIQEHVMGVQLHQMWPKMNSEQHMLCTKTLSLAIKKMASLDFPAYGSLYFSDAPIDPNKKVPFEQGFCIGPNCSPVFWNRNPGELELYGGPSPNCGPWKDLTSYYLGLIETGFSRLPKEPVTHELLPHQGSVEDHIRLLKISEEMMQRLVEDKRIQDAATPTLLHPDFHMRNIFVSAEEQTLITGIIDWQSTSIEPAFIYANETPDFAALPEEPGEDTFKSGRSEEKPPGCKERELKDASICYQTYDVCMKGLAPKLRPARLLDPSLFRLFQYCHTTWRDSAAALRQELIELSARWTKLGLQGACPFSPTEKEVKEHARDYEDFETFQKLKLWLKHSLHTNSDGLVPNDKWDAARDAHRAAYDQWMQTARESESRGEGLTVAKADKLWPFDAR